MILLNDQLQSHLITQHNYDDEQEDERSHPSSFHAKSSSTGEDGQSKSSTIQNQSLAIFSRGQFTISSFFLRAFMLATYTILAIAFGYYFADKGYNNACASDLSFGERDDDTNDGYIRLQYSSVRWRISFGFISCVICLIAMNCHLLRVSPFNVEKESNRNEKEIDGEFSKDRKIPHIHNIQNWTTNADMEEEEEDLFCCRKQIQKALGSIHAPSLSSPMALNKNAVTDFTHDQPHRQYSQRNKILAKWKDFAEYQAELIHIMEHAISTIRTVSSIRMGLGPFSPAVERIEDQSKQNLPNSAVASTGRFGVGMMGAARMRRILYESLKRQNGALNTLMTEVIHDEYNDDVHGQDCFTQEIHPNTLTIRLLKNCVKCNGQVLTNLLTLVLDQNSADFMSHGHGYLGNKNLLSLSIHETREQQAYLLSCFQLECQTDSCTTPKCTAEIQKHFNASHALIVAFIKALSSPPEEINVEENRVLWEDLSNSLRTLSRHCQSLSVTLFPDSDKTETVEALPENESNSSAQDPMEYDDAGIPKVAITPNNENGRENKTIIFSGNGSKVRMLNRRENDKKMSNTSNPHNRLLDGNAFEPTMLDRSTLIQELQSRLGKIELPEELETSTSNFKSDDATKDDLYNSKSNQNIKPTKRTNFFTGVTGNVLIELKDAMAMQHS